MARFFVDSAGGRFLRTEAGFPLGLRDGSFAEREVELAAGCRLVFFSDGLSEATSPAEEEYGTANTSTRSRRRSRVCSTTCTVSSQARRHPTTRLWS